MCTFKVEEPMVSLQTWTISLVTTAIAVLVSYLWLDIPIATFAHSAMTHTPIYYELTLLPEPLVPASLLALFGLGLWALAGRPLSRPLRVGLLCSVSLIVAETAKNELKYIFGRTWPETWTNGNPSLMHDGVYGFYFFHGGQGYASFPSGHTAAACAVVSVLWICYPRFRVVYAAAVAAVVIGLIGADYHFLSDIIAGGFVGTTTGWFTLLLHGEEFAKPSSAYRPIGFPR
jgi:membrane-associated phospholipid phosphatase